MVLKTKVLRNGMVAAFFLAGYCYSFSVLAKTPAISPEPEEDEISEIDEFSFAEEEEGPKLTVPYVPTPQNVVDKMLEMAKVTKKDTVYDLGCGDGRIVVTAAKIGAKGVGVDLDPERVKDSLENVKSNKVEKLVEIRKGDVLETDVSSASVVTLYLLPEVNLNLKPILINQLKPGSRVVSHDFDMGRWEPEKRVEVKSENGRTHIVYLWTIPKDKKALLKKLDKK